MSANNLASIVRRCIAALVMCMSLTGTCLASEANILPFFSKPYPFGYVGGRPATAVDCWQYRRVDTLLGSYTERVWVCGAPLSERY